MGEQNNATCSICGNGYHLCISCKDSVKLHPWKMHTDSASCYQVFQVVKGYSTGVYNREEFKSKLKNIDLSNLENYRDHIKLLIKDVLKEDEIVDEKPVVTEILTVEEKVVVEKPVVSRKRDYKVNNEVVKTK